LVKNDDLLKNPQNEFDFFCHQKTALTFTSLRGHTGG